MRPGSAVDRNPPASTNRRSFLLSAFCFLLSSHCPFPLRLLLSPFFLLRGTRALPAETAGRRNPGKAYRRGNGKAGHARAFCKPLIPASENNLSRRTTRAAIRALRPSRNPARHL